MTTFVKKIIVSFENRFDGHMSEVIQGAGIVLLLKVVAAGIGFTLNVLLARLLGAEGAGIYFLSLTIVTICMTVGRFGLDNTILRYIAAYSAKEEWGIVKAVYRNSMFISIIVSILVTSIIVLSAPFISVKIFDKPDLYEPICWMSLAILPLAMLSLHGEALKALKRVRDSQLVNGVIHPLVTICLVAIFVKTFGLVGAVWAYTLSAGVAALTGLWIWIKYTKPILSVREEFPVARLLQSCVPLFWVAMMGVATNWSSTIILGIWGTKFEMGLFGAATRTSMLTSFILVSVNSVLAPKFSMMYAINDRIGLERVARQSAKLMTCIAAPILLIFVIFPRYIMGLYGVEFESGGFLLSILAIGQFVNVATGSVGYLLMMTGNEKGMRNITIFVGVLSLVIGLITIPLWGANGAAFSTSISLSLLNIGAFYFVWKKLGIWTVPFIIKPGNKIK